MKLCRRASPPCAFGQPRATGNVQRPIRSNGFLIRERAAIPPSGPSWREKPRIPKRPRPRGAADPTRAPHRKLDHDNPTATDRRAGPNPHALPVLPSHTTKTTLSEIVVTQKN